MGLAALLGATSLASAAGTAKPVGATEGGLASLCGTTAFTPVSGPQQSTLGPDGNVWFTDGLGIGRVTPSGVVTTFGAGFTLGLDTPGGITAGPDGNLWFTVRQTTGRIGRITPDGAVTFYTNGIAPTSQPIDITAGPDGNLWYTARGTNQIVQITPGGAVTPFSVGPTSLNLLAITTGPDGKLWFTGTGVVGSMTTTGAVMLYPVGLTAGSSVTDITVGPDGNLWFVEYNRVAATAGVGKITPSGAVTEFAVPAGILTGIATAPDGSLWYIDALSAAGGRVGRVTTNGQVSLLASLATTIVLPGFGPLTLTRLPQALSFGSDGNGWVSTPQSIGRLTASGVFDEFAGSPPPSLAPDVDVAPDGAFWSSNPLGSIGYITPGGVSGSFPVSDPTAHGGVGGIAVAPDGNVWFTEPNDRVGRATVTGTGDQPRRLGDITRFTTGITPGSGPAALATGPDGNLWFTESGAHRIGRITPDGVITEFSQGITGRPDTIAAGGDGNVWFTEDDGGQPRRIGRITPSGAVAEFDPGIAPDSTIGELAAGPDGNEWFTDAASRIGRISPAGAVTFFTAGIPANAIPTHITAAGGDLWFTFYPFDTMGNLVNALGRITTSGAVTLFDPTPPPGGPTLPFPLAGPDHVVGGKNGDLWFTRFDPIDNVTHATIPHTTGDPCGRTVTGDVAGPVTVNTGETVTMTGARVAGRVTVLPGGKLSVSNSKITGGIAATAPGSLSVCGSQLAAAAPTPALSVSGARVPTRIGDPSHGCAPNGFAGAVVLQGDLADTLAANQVVGNVTVTYAGNGSTVLAGNRVTATLACSADNPAPTNSGRPNTAATKTGQCSGL